MKNKTSLITALLLSIIAITVQGQDSEFSRNFVTKVDLFTDLWQDTPDVMDENTLNRGVNIYGMYNFPIKNSSLSFEIGTGLGIHNLYHENTLLETDEGATYFGVIPDTTLDGSATEIGKSKMSLAYLDFPMEFKIQTQNDLRAAIGFKIGVLINSLNKYKGDDYTVEGNEQITVKDKNIDNTNPFRYGPTLRLGYKWIDLYAYYSLSTVFEENKGPEMYPISVGISVVKF